MLKAAQSGRVVITGGAGFLGSHFCDRLIAEGHAVMCVDNLLTGRLENIRHLRKHPRFEFMRADISLPETFERLEKLLRNARRTSSGRAPAARKISYVLNLASPASPVDYHAHPIATLRVGAMGTYNALEFARQHGARFLLTSTSEVYGDPEISPQVESYWGHVNPVGPRSVYDEAKRFAEALTMAYARERLAEVRIARIFNTYGQRMQIDDGRVLPNFMTQALRGKPLTVYGDGSQTRSLCFVSDMVDGLYRLLLSRETGPVNIGNPEEVTMLELAREVIQITGSRSKIVYQQLPKDDPRRRRPDISKAIAVLKWRPAVSRLDGLRRVLPYFADEIRKSTPKRTGVRRRAAGAPVAGKRL